MRCGKGNDEELALRFERRNPRECAVAKFEHITESIGKSRRNPRECAVAKMRDGKPLPLRRGHNPRECAVVKSRHCCARTGNSESMNYVLLF